MISLLPKYIITYTGKVWSCKNKRYLVPIFRQDGYAGLSYYKKNSPISYKIHRLIAQIYFKDQDLTLQVNHKDGNKINNHIDNLELVTAKENMAHARDILGRQILNNLLPGDSQRKLSLEQANQVRMLYKTGYYTFPQLAKQFNVSRWVIGFIVRNQTYKT